MNEYYLSDLLIPRTMISKDFIVSAFSFGVENDRFRKLACQEPDWQVKTADDLNEHNLSTSPSSSSRNRFESSSATSELQSNSRY